jgi:phenylalanyl-tRNA synthetase beta subunit
MKISYNWLSSYFKEKLPEPEALKKLLTMHSFEIESVEQKDSDYIFDAKVLPDRAHDLLSHVGMAREVHALTGAEIKQLLHPQTLKESAKIVVAVENQNDTPRFTTLHIENIQVKETSVWMKTFLEAIGQKSINNIVDITNLTMFHVGQPLHAYDRDKLEEKDGTWKLVSERAGREEDFEALDGKVYKITPEMLVIRDGHSGKTLGVAGIKGGVASKIDESTRHIIVEAANFNPTLIRKTSQKLKLRTDASERFEKEITPELTHTALEEMLALAHEEAFTPETNVEGVTDMYPRKRNPYVIGVSLNEITTKLGVALSQEEVEAILGRLGFEWKKMKPVDAVLGEATKYIGVPYKYGTSISFDAPKTFDCSAFVAYLYAHAGVALPRITIDQFVWGESINKENLKPGDVVFSKTGEDKLAEFTLVTGERVTQQEVHKVSIELPGVEVPEGVEHNGIYLGDNKIIHASGKWHKGEVVVEDLTETPAFKDIRGYRRFSDNTERYVVTVPPERLDLMARRAFLVSGNKEDLIEEIGRLYGYENIQSVPLPATSFSPKVNKEISYTDKIKDELIAQGYSEVYTYAFVKKGEVELANPLAQDKKFLRGSLLPELERAHKENKLNKDLLGVSDVKIFEIGRIFKDNKEILTLAAIPNVNTVLGKPVSDAEIDLSKLFETLPEPTPYEFKVGESSNTFVPFSSYPFIVRDLALFVPAGITPEEVQRIFNPLLGKLCVRLNLFDSFLKTLPDGTKHQSYAWRFVFQSMDRTLTDEEVNAMMKNITLRLEQEKEFEIR